MKHQSYNWFYKVNKGWGTIENVVLILVLGLLLVIIAYFITSSAVVVNEYNDKDLIEKVARNYFSNLSRQAKNVDFFNNMSDGEFSHIPLTSEYTRSGKFSILVETETQPGGDKKIIMTFRKPAATSYDDPLMVISTLIEVPEGIDSNYYFE